MICLLLFAQSRIFNHCIPCGSLCRSPMVSLKTELGFLYHFIPSILLPFIAQGDRYLYHFCLMAATSFMISDCAKTNISLISCPCLSTSSRLIDSSHRTFFSLTISLFLHITFIYTLKNLLLFHSVLLLHSHIHTKTLISTRPHLQYYSSLHYLAFPPFGLSYFDHFLVDSSIT